MYLDLPLVWQFCFVADVAFRTYHTIGTGIANITTSLETSYAASEIHRP